MPKHWQDMNERERTIDAIDKHLLQIQVHLESYYNPKHKDQCVAQEIWESFLIQAQTTIRALQELAQSK